MEALLGARHKNAAVLDSADKPTQLLDITESPLSMPVGQKNHPLEHDSNF